MGKPHVLMIPLPAQGHVIPLLELATVLAKHGVQVTFVNLDIIHSRIVDTSSPHIHLVSISDGLESHERLVPGRCIEVWYDSMPQKVEQIIKENSVSEDEKFSCVISDQSLGRIQQVAKKMGIASVAFLPAAAASLVLGFNIPKMIENGIIDGEGTPLKQEIIQFAPTMPNMVSSDFTWVNTRILSRQKAIFNIMMQNDEAIKSADWTICNSIQDLEPGAFSLAPNVVPIGPLLASIEPGNSAGHFLEHDSTCLDWLDHQPVHSVVYAAFGSTTIFSPSQFRELALGLELTGRPFLWVRRSENSTTGVGNQAFPEGFLKRISSRGLITNCAPQQKVLSHPSIACFLSHCGWNSTVESVSNGVPMLCLPYFADQFINRSYITDIWKVGLPFEHDDGGIIGKEEIKNRVDQVLGDHVFKQRALQLQKIIQDSASKGGNSYENLTNFVKWIQG
ncbi:UDP-glycosyltransferase 83A1-like [Primulina huaijiensis]|uniref:UDP-glycosyltransferase 83A1-like n=1 Tax=Primulina huaijiensis TaxID=1492673 RepID=UPI003CC6E0D4